MLACGAEEAVLDGASGAGTGLLATGVAEVVGSGLMEMTLDVGLLATEDVMNDPPVGAGAADEATGAADEAGALTALDGEDPEDPDPDELDPPPTPATAAQVPVTPESVLLLVVFLVTSASGPGLG